MDKDEKNLLTVAFWIGVGYLLAFLVWIVKYR
jgi:hypothetical protein